MRKNNFQINAERTHVQQPGGKVDDAKSNTAIIAASENKSAIGEGLFLEWIPYGVTFNASLARRKNLKVSKLI